MTIPRLDHVGSSSTTSRPSLRSSSSSAWSWRARRRSRGRRGPCHRARGRPVDFAMMRAPDGHGRLELMKFHTPTAGTADHRRTHRSTPCGFRRIMFIVDDIEAVTVPACAARGAESSATSRSTRTATGSATSAAPRASSSRWPRTRLRIWGHPDPVGLDTARDRPSHPTRRTREGTPPWPSPKTSTAPPTRSGTGSPSTPAPIWPRAAPRDTRTTACTRSCSPRPDAGPACRAAPA